MDWDGTNKSIIPSMEFYDDPQQVIVNLIQRITDLENTIAIMQQQIANLMSR